MPLFSKKKESPEFYHFFRNILGYTPRKTELYHIAFTHRSQSGNIHGHRVNNERLEYLGDAVLGAVVAEYLYKKYPFEGEGFLTVLRSKIVSRASLGQLARKIRLPELVEYQRNQQGVFKSLGGDAFEALVGAMYLEKGYNFTRKVLVDRILRVYLDVDSIAVSDWNYKSKLIDWGQKNHRKISFEVVAARYCNNKSRKEYECRVNIDGEPQQTGIDYTIKAAEQLAAEKTYKALEASGVIQKQEQQS